MATKIGTDFRTGPTGTVFPQTIPYLDAEGYTGDIDKSGAPFTQSGTYEPDKKNVTHTVEGISSEANSYPNTYEYNVDKYVGKIYRSGSPIYSRTTGGGSTTGTDHRILGSQTGFPETVPYDSGGYSGTLSKSGSPYVNNGSAPSNTTKSDSKLCTVTQSWVRKESGSAPQSKSASKSQSGSVTSRFVWSGGNNGSWSRDSSSYSPGTYSYSSGGYSGTLHVSGASAHPDSPPLSAGRGSAAGTTTTRSTTATLYYEGEVSTADTRSWYWAANGSSTHNASSTMSYSDGTYSGTLSLNGVSGSPSEPTWTAVVGATTSTNAAGTASYSGTVSTADTRTWRQNYSGTVTASSRVYYNQSYSGEVLGPYVDTRVWRQNYSGTVVKPIYDKVDGLSPDFGSVAHPSIPESFFLRWQFSTVEGATQSKAVITLYDAANVQIATHTINGAAQELDLTVFANQFQSGQVYHWDIEGYSTRNPNEGTLSKRALFQYEPITIPAVITWGTYPNQGDRIEKQNHFLEIKEKLKIVLWSKRAPESLVNKADALFTGKIIPSREDFNNLQSLLNDIDYLVGSTNKVDAITPVLNSLGASDISLIFDWLKSVMAKKPNVPGTPVVIPAPINLYKVKNVNIIQTNSEDTSVDIGWEVDPVLATKITFDFNAVAPGANTNIKHYEARFKYGKPESPYISRLFFRPQDIEGQSIDFEIDWTGMYQVGEDSTSKNSLSLTAVDEWGNVSEVAKASLTYGENTKIPLGVKQYEVEYQKLPMSATTYDVQKPWIPLYMSSGLSTSHNISAGEGKYFYRVRAEDLSGLETEWTYATSHATFEPLTAPASVSYFVATDSSDTSITLAWSSSPKAKQYKIMESKTTVVTTPQGTNSSTTLTKLWEGTDTSATLNGLKANTSYDLVLYAINDAGADIGVYCVGKTKSTRITSSFAVKDIGAWNSLYGWTADAKNFYQGQWCENGTCYGLNTGLWYYDSTAMRQTLAGRKIIDVKIVLNRIKATPGYGDDKTNPTFVLHSYDYTGKPAGAPSVNSPYTPPDSFNLDGGLFTDLGRVPLPVSFGEKLRDNKANGIGIHTTENRPYMKINGWLSWLEVTHIEQ